MNKFFLSLVLSLLCLSCKAQSCFEVLGVRLGRPCDEIIRDFKEKGFSTLANPEHATLMLGDFPGFEQVILVFDNTVDVCHYIGGMKVCDGTAVEAYASYEQAKSMVTKLYGVEGKEMFEYGDTSYENKTTAEKAAAIAADETKLMCTYEVDHGEVVVLFSKQDAGLTVVLTFVDEEADQMDESPEEEKKDEKKSGTLTRFKGISINRPLSEVKKDLIMLGFVEEDDSEIRNIYRKKNMIKYTGDFFGNKNCTIVLTYGDYEGEDFVEALSVEFPPSTTWRQLYEKYLGLRSSIVEKYGLEVTFEDSVNGRTDNLLDMNNYQALHAIQTNNHNLETLMLNPADLHAFKIVPSCIEVYGVYTYFVSLHYLTPFCFLKEMNKSNDL